MFKGLRLERFFNGNERSFLWYICHWIFKTKPKLLTLFVNTYQLTNVSLKAVVYAVLHSVHTKR